MMILPQPWKEEDHYKHGYVDEVPVQWLKQFRGNSLRRDEEEMRKLKESIIREGLKEPVMLIVGLHTRHMYLGEGNHRLVIFDEIGMELIPARVWIYEYGCNTNSNPKFNSKEYPHLNLPDDPFYYSLSVRPNKIITKYEMLYPVT